MKLNLFLKMTTLGFLRVGALKLSASITFNYDNTPFINYVDILASSGFYNVANLLLSLFQNIQVKITYINKRWHIYFFMIRVIMRLKGAVPLLLSEDVSYKRLCEKHNCLFV